MKEDKVTLKRIELLHPAVRDEALQIYREANEALTGRAILRFSQTLRTFQEQDKLYAQGRSKKGRIVTGAKGGQSYHNYGLAIDIVLLKDTNGDGSYETASWQTNVDFDGDGIADWMEVVDIFRKYGWQWGLINSRGKRYDLPHFQKAFGHSTYRTLLDKYNRKDFIQGTTYVNL